jgi:hypothetical protein
MWEKCNVRRIAVKIVTSLELANNIFRIAGKIIAGPGASYQRRDANSARYQSFGSGGGSGRVMMRQ